MANVAGVLIQDNGQIVGFQADLTSVTDFSLPGQQTPRYFPQLVELKDGEADYGALPADCGDSTKTAAQRLAAFNTAAGSGSIGEMKLANPSTTEVTAANPIRRDIG